MSFVRTDLAFLAGANNGGPRLWSYKSADGKSAVDTAGYFNIASAQLNVGDFIFANVSDGYGVFVVNANSGGVVDVADLTAFGGTDTD